MAYYGGVQNRNYLNPYEKYGARFRNLAVGTNALAGINPAQVAAGGVNQGSNKVVTKAKRPAPDYGIDNLYLSSPALTARTNTTLAGSEVPKTALASASLAANKQKAVGNGWKIRPWTENGITYGLGNDGFMYSAGADGNFSRLSGVQADSGLPPAQIGPDDPVWFNLSNGQIGNRVTGEIFIKDPSVVSPSNPMGWRVNNASDINKGAVQDDTSGDAMGTGMPPGGWNVKPYQDTDGIWTATGADGKKYILVNGKWQVNETTMPNVGDVIDNPDDGKTYEWDGTTWVEVVAPVDDGSGAPSTIKTTRTQDEIKQMLDDLWARFNEGSQLDLTGAAPPGQDFSINLNQGNTSFADLISQLTGQSAYSQGRFDAPRVDVSTMDANAQAQANVAASAANALAGLNFNALSGDTQSEARQLMYNLLYGQAGLAGATGVANKPVTLPGEITGYDKEGNPIYGGPRGINEATTKSLLDTIGKGYTGISDELYDRLYTATMRPYEQQAAKEMDWLREDAQNRGVFYSGYMTKDQDEEKQKLLNIAADKAAELALTSQQFGQERYSSAISQALGLSELQGNQARAIGQEEIQRAGVGSDFLSAREAASVAAAQENRAISELKMKGATSAADIFARISGDQLEQGRINLDAAIAEDKSLAEREAANLKRLDTLQAALQSQDISQRGNAQLELDRINSEQAELRSRRDEIRANQQLQIQERTRLDNFMNDATGQEIAYNLAEQASINGEYNAEWLRQFTRLIAEFDLNAQLRAEDLATVNAILQVISPGLIAKEGDTLLGLLQGITHYAGQGG